MQILQESGRTVELVLSQIYKPYRSNEITDISTHSRLPDVDYLKRIRYETDEAHLSTQQRNEVKTFAKNFRGINEQLKIPVKVYMASGLHSAKSMPDLPRVGMFFSFVLLLLITI